MILYNKWLGILITCCTNNKIFIDMKIDDMLLKKKLLSDSQLVIMRYCSTC